MRKFALIEDTCDEVTALIIHECEYGVYIYTLGGIQGEVNLGDHYFATVGEAEATAESSWGVRRGDWIDLGDPPRGYAADSIKPLRVE